MQKFRATTFHFPFAGYSLRSHERERYTSAYEFSSRGPISQRHSPAKSTRRHFSSMEQRLGPRWLGNDTVGCRDRHEEQNYSKDKQKSYEGQWGTLPEGFRCTIVIMWSSGSFGKLENQNNTVQMEPDLSLDGRREDTIEVERRNCWGVVYRAAFFATIWIFSRRWKEFRLFEKPSWRNPRDS